MAADRQQFAARGQPPACAHPPRHCRPEYSSHDRSRLPTRLRAFSPMGSIGGLATNSATDSSSRLDQDPRFPAPAGTPRSPACASGVRSAQENPAQPQPPAFQGQPGPAESAWPSFAALHYLRWSEWKTLRRACRVDTADFRLDENLRGQHPLRPRRGRFQGGNCNCGYTMLCWRAR